MFASSRRVKAKGGRGRARYLSSSTYPKKSAIAPKSRGMFVFCRAVSGLRTYV